MVDIFLNLAIVVLRIVRTCNHQVLILTWTWVTQLHTFINKMVQIYSLHTRKECRFGQGHGLQSLTLTSYFYKNIYHNIIYLYFFESIFQDKSIHIVFVFWISTIWKLFMIYIPNVWPKPCPKRHSFRVWRE